MRSDLSLCCASPSGLALFFCLTKKGSRDILNEGKSIDLGPQDAGGWAE